jgi:hypothetical protein
LHIDRLTKWPTIKLDVAILVRAGVLITPASI